MSQETFFLVTVLIFIIFKPIFAIGIKNSKFALTISYHQQIFP